MEENGTFKIFGTRDLRLLRTCEDRTVITAKVPDFRTHGLVDGDMYLNFCNQGLVDEMEALKARGQKLNDLMNAHDQERRRKAGLVEDEFRNKRNRQLRDQRTRLADVEKAQEERARKERMIGQEFEQANREPLDEQQVIRAKVVTLQKRINEETVLVTCCLDALLAETNLRRKKEKLELTHDAKRMDDHFLCWRNFVFEGEPRILDKIRGLLKSSG